MQNVQYPLIVMSSADKTLLLTGPNKPAKIYCVFKTIIEFPALPLRRSGSLPTIFMPQNSQAILRSYIILLLEGFVNNIEGVSFNNYNQIY